MQGQWQQSMRHEQFVWLVAMSHSLWFSGYKRPLSGALHDVLVLVVLGTLQNQPPAYPGLTQGHSPNGTMMGQVML